MLLLLMYLNDKTQSNYLLLLKLSAFNIFYSVLSLSYRSDLFSIIKNNLSL